MSFYIPEMAEKGDGSLRRLLMLAYNFPPRDTGVSHHRPEALYRHIADFGWQPHVITAQRPGTPVDVLQIEDRSIAGMKESAGPAVAAMRQGNNALKRIGDGRLAPFVERAKRELRRLPGYRDDYMAFSRAVVPLAIAEGRRINADAVWTSCNPFSLAPAAVEVAEALGVPCLVDLRDPLFDHLRYAEGHGHWFYRALAQADAVSICSPVCADSDLVKAIAPRRTQLILSGLWNAPGQLEPINSSRFVITHAGYMYRQGHFPEMLFEGLLQFLERHPAARNDVQLQFIGLDTRYLRHCPSFGKIAGNIELLPETPYASVLEKLKSASLLLLFNRTIEGEQREGIRAKLFDYLAVGAPILHLCNDKGITGELLAWSAAGESLSSSADIAEAISRHYARWKQPPPGSGGVPPLRAGSNPQVLAWLDQQRMAAQFAEVLNALVEKRAPRSMAGAPWLTSKTDAAKGEQ